MLALVAQFVPQSTVGPWTRDVLLYVGLALLVATFPLYYLYANRCPRCRQSFSRAPEYRDVDTNGLALFHAIHACPFCRLVLNESEGSPARS